MAISHGALVAVAKAIKVPYAGLDDAALRQIVYGFDTRTLDLDSVEEAREVITRNGALDVMMRWACQHHPQEGQLVSLLERFSHCRDQHWEHLGEFIPRLITGTSPADRALILEYPKVAPHIQEEHLRLVVSAITATTCSAVLERVADFDGTDYLKQPWFIHQVLAITPDQYTATIAAKRGRVGELLELATVSAQRFAELRARLPLNPTKSELGELEQARNAKYKALRDWEEACALVNQATAWYWRQSSL